MGNTLDTTPLLTEHTAVIMAQYNIQAKHVKRLYALFTEMDVNRTGKWTIVEINQLMDSYPESLVTPCLEALVKFGSSGRDGRLTFEDVIVTLCSFCALSKEELLQYVYLIIDADRSGVLDREELTNFYSSSVFVKSKRHHQQASYPANYVGALKEFGKGQWQSLVFEEFCLMCDLFPHLAFPAIHLQNMLRREILGARFWRDWDVERLKIFHLETESKTITFTGPSLITGETITIVKPGRITMKEIFEFTKRNGLKREVEWDAESNSFTKNRDAILRRAPLLNLIRNPNSVYHVPIKSLAQGQSRVEAEGMPMTGTMGRTRMASMAFLGALDKGAEKIL